MAKFSQLSRALRCENLIHLGNGAGPHPRIPDQIYIQGLRKCSSSQGRHCEKWGVFLPRNATENVLFDGNLTVIFLNHAAGPGFQIMGPQSMFLFAVQKASPDPLITFADDLR